MHVAGSLAAFVIPLLLCCGTGTSSLQVSPPPAETRMAAEALDPLDSFVEMGSHVTKQHIVSGMEHDQQTGHWLAQSGATLRFLTLPLDEIRFGLNFSVPPKILKQHSPLKLRIRLNGHPFLEKALDTAGLHTIDEAIPKGLVTWEHETQVEIFVDSPAGRPIQQPAIPILSVGFRP